MWFFEQRSGGEKHLPWWRCWKGSFLIFTSVIAVIIIAIIIIAIIMIAIMIAIFITAIIITAIIMVIIRRGTYAMATTCSRLATSASGGWELSRWEFFGILPERKGGNRDPRFPLFCNSARFWSPGGSNPAILWHTTVYFWIFFGRYKIILTALTNSDSHQVAAILRSAGQECIRLVVARPIDPAEIHQPVSFNISININFIILGNKIYLW